MKYELQQEERETIVNFDDSSNECNIYTCSKSVMRRLDKLCLSHPTQYQLIKQDEYSKTYNTTKDLIKFGTKRKLSEEQIEKKRITIQKTMG